jgi:hypothetical protein
LEKSGKKYSKHDGKKDGTYLPNPEESHNDHSLPIIQHHVQQ